jgi:hypothetical protein
MSILARSEVVLRLRHAGDVEELREAVQAAMQQGAQAMEGFADRWTSARREELHGALQWQKHGTEAIMRALVREDYVRAPGTNEDALVAALVRAWQAAPGYTRADLCNAITRAAHAEEWATPWTQEALEEQGGGLLYQRVTWQRIGDAAADVYEQGLQAATQALAQPTRGRMAGRTLEVD